MEISLSSGRQNHFFMEYSAVHLYWSQQNRNAGIMYLGKVEKTNSAAVEKVLSLGWRGQQENGRKRLDTETLKSDLSLKGW